MRTRLLTAIVLHSQNYGEADRIVTFFTKELGKVSGIAKGVRKPKSRKRGSLDVFNCVKIQITDSPKLGIVTEGQLVNSFPGIRSDLKKMSVAYFFCEVTKKITVEHAPHEEIFNLLHDSLSQVETGEATKTLKNSFTLQILEEAGFITEETEVSDPQRLLEQIIERNLGSVRIGKMLQ